MKKPRSKTILSLLTRGILSLPPATSVFVLVVLAVIPLVHAQQNTAKPALPGDRAPFIDKALEDPRIRDAIEKAVIDAAKKSGVILPPQLGATQDVGSPILPPKPHPDPLVPAQPGNSKSLVVPQPSPSPVKALTNPANSMNHCDSAAAAFCAFITEVIKTNAQVRSLLLTNWQANQELEATRIQQATQLVQFEVQRERSNQAYATNYNKHQSYILRHRATALEWNAYQSKIIFAFAHVILIVGIWAAIREFMLSMKHFDVGQEIRAARVATFNSLTPAERATFLAAPAADGARPLEEIEIGPEKVAIKTATRAIWLLLSAFAFYYLYIHFVYPLTELGQ